MKPPYPIPYTLSPKSGISLIAVLMFMLAATTASVVVYRQLGQENLTSGARLKASEAYQASESGLDVVQSWLTNRTMDVGALAGAFLKESNNGAAILLTDNSNNVLKDMGGSRSQNYKVYLTGIDTSDMGKKPMKFKFLSIGTGRDSSKVNQTAIFSVDGLYKVRQPADKPRTSVDFNQAFFGGFSSNTQGKFSSAVIHGDAQINGLTTTGNLLVTGSLSVLDNSDNRIGCISEEEKNRGEQDGDLYVTGDLNFRGFTVCGNAFVGGNLTATSKPLFRKDLFVAGNVINPHIAVKGSMTLGGIINRDGNDGMLVQGNFVMTNVRDSSNSNTWARHAERPGLHGNIRVENELFVNGSGGVFGGNGIQDTFPDWAGFTVGGSVWTDVNFMGTNSVGRAGIMNFGTNSARNPNVYVPNSEALTGNDWRNNNEEGNVHFRSYSGSNPKVLPPTAGNTPAGATNLDELAEKVEMCTRKNGTRELCVPDPLVLPKETSDEWTAKANALDRMANPANDADTTALKNISNACLKLLKKNNANDNVNDNKGSWYSCNANANAASFVRNVNQCYSDLVAGNVDSLLYVGSDGVRFLAVNMDGSCQKSPGVNDIFNGKFIFVFQENISGNIKLGLTTKDAVVFMYLKEGASGTMAMEGSRNDGKNRNYFIFAEKDIAGMSGSTTINGTIFMADGAKSGAITDTDINFNQTMFDALVEAGILEKNFKDGEEKTNECPPGETCEPPNPYEITDDYFIPISNMLNVKLESKGVSKEKEPVIKKLVEKEVLVMPRVVRMTTDAFKSSYDFNDYYTFIYINGAETGNANTSTPVCTKDGITLNTSRGSTNPEGVYTCTIPSGTGSVRHSDFYVKVAGEGAGNEVWIEPAGTKEIIRSENGTYPCEIVSLQASENADNNWEVTIALTSGGDGWEIRLANGSPCIPNQLNDNWACTFPPDSRGFSALEVCPLQDYQNRSNVVLDARQTNGNFVIKEGKRQSIIRTEAGAPATVTRNQPENNGWVECRYKPATWIDVTCTDKTIETPNKQWKCEVGPEATWNIQNVPASCEPVGNISSGTVTANVKSGDNPFEAELKLKEYTLRVSGLDASVVLTTTDPDVTVKTQTCNGNTGCKVYHGITYSVTHPSGAANWTCSRQVCNGEYLRPTGTGETITPDNDVLITLSGLTVGLTSCRLKDNQQVIRGQNLAALNTYVNDYIHQGPCGTPTFNYSVSSTNTNTVGAQITITMGITCNGGFAVTDGNANVLCSGNITVVDEAAPSIVCAWANGVQDYYIGNTPTVNVTVMDGSVTTCAAPTVTASTFAGSTTAANWNAASGTKPNYAIASKNALTAMSNNNSVTVRAVCTGGTKNGNYDASCTGKNVGDKQPCQAAANFNTICPGISLYDVKWNSNPTPNTTTSQGCHYVSGLGAYINVNNESGAVRINGRTYNSYSTDFPEKTDNGYYIYIGSNGAWAEIPVTAGNAKPACAPDPEPALKCVWNPATNPQIGRFVNGTQVEGGAIPTPTITCQGTTTTTVSAGNITWSSQPFGANVSAGQYNNVTATVASGCGTTQKQVNCGNLLVRNAPRINQCNFANATGNAGTSLTKPAVTLTDQSNLCSNNGSNNPNASWTSETWNYTVPNNGTFNWASLPTSTTYPIVYNNFNVRGNCGDYGEAPQANCTGQVTVTQPAGGGGTLNFTPSEIGTVINPGTYTITCQGGGSSYLSCFSTSGATITSSTGDSFGFSNTEDTYWGKTFDCGITVTIAGGNVTCRNWY